MVCRSTGKGSKAARNSPLTTTQVSIENARVQGAQVNLQQDHELDCPSCGESLTLLIDASVPSQTYVEDCHVCCRPMVVTVLVEEGIVVSLEARPEND